jgi:hypothetical protein
VLWRDYQRHNTKQAEKVLEFLGRIEAECGLAPERDLIFFTGSGAGLIAPLVGGKVIQEVVAVAAAVEKLHPDVHFVSEIGGEDMKTIFFTASGEGKAKQVYMQSACSGGTGTFIEKTARKLQITPEELAGCPMTGRACTRSAPSAASSPSRRQHAAQGRRAGGGDHRQPVRGGGLPEPRDAHQGQHAAAEVLLLGGPNLFFEGLQAGLARHLQLLWTERGVALPEGREPGRPHHRARRCALLRRARLRGDRRQGRGAGRRPLHRAERLAWWIEEGQHEAKAQGGRQGAGARRRRPLGFRSRYEKTGGPSPARRRRAPPGRSSSAATSAARRQDRGAVADKEMLFSAYAPSKGNPIEDAKALFRQMREAGVDDVAGLALTGYGKDLLKDIVGADLGVVETVAHAKSALHVSSPKPT